MKKATKTLAHINRALESSQSTGFRAHLGASVLGKKCARQIWYIFRWAKKARHSGRLLRLFDRGNREEAAIVKRLRQAGVHVEDIDPSTGEQYHISDFHGHLGGSLDGKLFDSPEFPGLWVLGEFKTHNERSFKEVTKEGVEKAKYEHFVQAQLYMRYQNLPAALYFAVNKNDDDMDIQVVEFDAAVAERFVARAHQIIYAPHPPERLPNASLGWYLCNFCDYKLICHSGEKKEKNCRTCRHSVPIEGFTWLCTKFNYPLTQTEQKRGCTEHSMILED